MRRSGRESPTCRARHRFWPPRVPPKKTPSADNRRAPSAAPLAAAMPTGLARASPCLNKLLLPLLSAHGLVRDGINDVTVLRALVEHSEVLTQGHKGRQLVVHPDANRARGALRHRRNRGGRVLVEPA